MSSDTVQRAADTLARQAGSTVQDARERAKRVAEAASPLAEKAKSTIDEMSESAREAVDKAAPQAKQMADDLYSRGEQASRQAVQMTRENPLVALLMAGAVGFMVGYLIKGR
ncbi:MAG TPA: hypothetical protein VKZ79_21055 [Alphaproteobacteria bacterium]|nr:hypothetical protein [Alphaproteobacteria bacterium]